MQFRQYVLGSITFTSLTSRSNLFFRNDVFADTIYTGLISFLSVDNMLLILFSNLAHWSKLGHSTVGKRNITASNIDWDNSRFII